MSIYSQLPESRGKKNFEKLNFHNFLLAKKINKIKSNFWNPTKYSDIYKNLSEKNIFFSFSPSIHLDLFQYGQNSLFQWMFRYRCVCDMLVDWLAVCVLFIDPNNRKKTKKKKLGRETSIIFIFIFFRRKIKNKSILPTENYYHCYCWWWWWWSTFGSLFFYFHKFYWKKRIQIQADIFSIIIITIFFDRFFFSIERV